MFEDNPMGSEEFDTFGEDIAKLAEGIKTGKKPSLKDILLYQRVLNYNMIVTYKNMLVIMKAMVNMKDQLEKLEKSQEDTFLQVQEFLDAHKLIKNIDEPEPPK